MTDIKRKVIINNRAFFNEIERYLAEGRQVSFLVRGESMRPFLFEGDKVMVSKPSARHWKFGDVILAKWGDNYVLHRLVKRKKNLLGLAGDANFVQIEWIKEEDIIALALYAYRGDKIIWTAEDRFKRICGMCWFFLRPFRRVVAKVKKKEKTGL